MFIANKIIYGDNTIYYKGQQVPEDIVSDHLIQIGAIVNKEDKKHIEEDKKPEPVNNIKPNPVRQKVERKPKILVEDSSKVEIVKE